MEKTNIVAPKGLQSLLRQKFCIVKGSKFEYRSNCRRCTREMPKLYTLRTGNLPEDRVTDAQPFLISGVDICGSVWVHNKIR